MIIRERFVIARPLEAALALFDDVPDIIGCVPGARVTAQHADGSYAALIGAKYGEMGVQFSGTVRGERTAPDTLRVRAEGTDGRNVGAVGDIRLTFAESEPGLTTVEIAASLSFSGMFTAIAYSATKVVGPKLLRGFAECLAAKAAAPAQG